MKASKRKRSLKRTLAFVSALSMLGSFSQAIGATTLSYNIISAVAEGEDIEPTSSTETTSGVVTTTSIESTSGVETTTTGVETPQPTPQEGGDGDANKKVIVENDQKFSRIKVEISNQMDMSFDGIKCTVKVVDTNGVDILADNGNPTVVTVNDGIGESASVMTEYITSGDYIVTVEAPGFKAFEQTIPANELENMMCTVKVTLGFHKNYSYGLEPMRDDKGDYITNLDGDIIYKEPKTVNHPGVLVYGDINGYDGNNGESNNNKSIDVSDATLLATAIDSYIRLEEATNEYNQAKKVYDSDKTDANKKAMDAAEKAMNTAKEKADKYPLDKYDLNHDGKIDMSDMSYFTKGFIDTRGFETEATIEREVSEKYSAFVLQDSVETLPDTVVSEDGSTLEDLLRASIANNSEEGGEIQEIPPMKLKPAKDENGNPQSLKDHPVGFDMAINDEGVKGFSFKTGNENGEGKVTEGFIEYSGENGETVTVALKAEGINGLGEESPVTASVDKDGNISINLGNQIGIKKIRLKITAANNTNLAEIAEVKILNGLESKVQEPPIDYPTDVSVTQDTEAEDKYAKIDVLWSPVQLGGGTYEYEVSSSPSTKPDGSFASTIAKKVLSDKEITESMAANNGKIGFFLKSEHGNFKLIKTNTTYYVHVRSVSAGGEDYKSIWSDAAKVHVEPQEVPAKPDYVTIKGGTKSLNVSWSSSRTNSATSYLLCYGKRSEVQDVAAETFTSDKFEDAKTTFENANYTCVELGKTTNYTIIGLEDNVEYNVFVVACNKNGGSERSDVKSGKTIMAVPVQMHRYGAINIDDKGNIGSEHIVNVYRGSAGSTVGNSEDEENAKKVAAGENDAKLTTWAIVDGDQGSYYAKTSGSGDLWNNGGYNGPSNDSFVFEFDDVYEFSSFAVTYPYSNNSIAYSCVRYWDEKGYYTLKNIGGYSTFTDKNGNQYYLVRLPQTIKTNKLQIGLDTYRGHISVAEMAFYTKDETREKIKNLYADEYHLVLKDDVTQETIDELRKEIAAKDRWGETNPDRSTLTTELDAAEKLLHNAASLNPPVMIYNKITTNTANGGKAVNYNGLNAWQPLGVSAGANTKILVYVGSSDMNNDKLGSATNLELVCTQYNSESNGLTLKSQKLYIGENEVFIPAGSLANDEGGGSLYISYSGAMNSSKSYSVRVAGGSPISVLDLFYVNDRMERLERAADYIEALERQVADMKDEHEYAHANAKHPDTNEPNTQLNHEYNAKTCIAGATEILSNKMMYSIPAAQVLAGLGGKDSSVESRAEKLVQSIDAMENMLTLFYQHKGLNPNTSQNSVNNGSGVAGVDINKISNQHLNIRYQRMFEGASMYAAGNHIGIQYGTASGLVNV
ncbi:MAG: fibronectin type III domain-containing protein, partial [Ruminococcus sp.]|nr:fibronectin type III domain-containing protein [Ruminococcus sp.]